MVIHERRYGSLVAIRGERGVVVDLGYARERKCIVDSCNVVGILKKETIRAEVTLECSYLEACKFVEIIVC